MTHRISPWWYALPAAIAAVTVLVGGVLLGVQLGDAGRTVVTRLDQIDRITPTGLHVTLQAGERRTIAAGTVYGTRPDPSTVRCRVTPADGQVAPLVDVLGPASEADLRLQVDGRYWWPMYRVEAVADGQLVVQCVARSNGTEFVLGPWFEGSDFAGNGAAAVVAITLTSVGLLVALVITVVLLVLQLTRRDRHAGAHP
jgi:hypothetical protein